MYIRIIGSTHLLVRAHALKLEGVEGRGFAWDGDFPIGIPHGVSQGRHRVSHDFRMGLLMGHSMGNFTSHAGSPSGLPGASHVFPSGVSRALELRIG